MVPIIIFIFKKDFLHWSVWPSVILCLIGGYLLTNFQDATVRLGDTLVVLGALFWSTHIIFTGMIVKKYNLPLTIGAIQTLLVALFSFIIGLFSEEFVIANILNEIDLCSKKYNSSTSSNNFFFGGCVCNNCRLVSFKSNIRH